jgi:uncharacterized protein
MLTNRVALITGAASGIGAELARLFATKGYRVALVDKSSEGLAAVRTEIIAAGGAPPFLLPCDLAQSGACKQIANVLAAQAFEVEFVVNNAGFGLFGRAIELSLEEQRAMIAVNILALTDLSLRFSASLIRHRGGILVVASLAGFLPGPGMDYITPQRATFYRLRKPCGRNSHLTACV